MQQAREDDEFELHDLELADPASSRGSEHKPLFTEEDDDNPMSVRLRELRHDVRQQIANDNKKAIPAISLDKVKGSKLFQKFLQKEQKVTNPVVKQTPPTLLISKESDSLKRPPSAQNIKIVEEMESYPYQHKANVKLSEKKYKEEDQRYQIAPDEPSLANDGELVGFSEQIIGRINDMAPGIPNQDEVLSMIMQTQLDNQMYQYEFQT